MSASVNVVHIIGNLGKNPDLTFTGNGNAVCKFPVATSEEWKDKDDVKQSKTTWHNIVVWGKSAENCAKFLAKGRAGDTTQRDTG